MMNTMRKTSHGMGMPSAAQPTTPAQAKNIKMGRLYPEKSLSVPRMGLMTATHSVTMLAAYPQYAVAVVASTPPCPAR